MGALGTVEAVNMVQSAAKKIKAFDGESFCGCLNQCLRYLQEYRITSGNDTLVEDIKEGTARKLLMKAKVFSDFIWDLGRMLFRTRKQKITDTRLGIRYFYAHRWT